MAHPFAGHKQNAVEKRRVKVLMRSGGYSGTSDAADDRSMLKHMQRHIAKFHGEHGGEYADGGRIDKMARGGRMGKITPKKHKPHIKINILNAPGGGEKPPLALGAPGLPGPIAAPTPRMPMPPPGGPPLGGPPPVPGMKRGGRAYISGVSTPENLKKWKGYAEEGTAKRASGGRLKVPTAWQTRVGGTEKTTKPGEVRKGKRFGEGSGEGREEEARHHKSRYP